MLRQTRHKTTPRRPRWPRLQRRHPLAQVWAWLRDWPRPTWECWHSGDEGRSIHLTRRKAQEFADNDNAADAEAAVRSARWRKEHCGGDGVPEPIDPDDRAYVRRGPWMRPSEVDALPEY